MNMLLVCHRIAVLTSVDLVDTVRPADLIGLPVQGLGPWRPDFPHDRSAPRIRYAARGHCADLPTGRWNPFVDKVRRIRPAHTPDAARTCCGILGRWSDGRRRIARIAVTPLVPGSSAMGFHFVRLRRFHAGDVRASISVGYGVARDVLAAVLPLVLAVPDGEVASRNIPFDPAVDPVDGQARGDRADPRHLGRTPDGAPRHRQSPAE